MNDNESKPELSHRFYCEKCKYGTSKKSNINTHYLSARHIKTTEVNEDFAILSKKYKCDKCEKSYNDRVGLWRHKKKCIKNSSNELLINKEMFIMLLQQNKELNNVILEQSKQILELSKNKNFLS